MPTDITLATLNLFNNSHSRWAERAQLVHDQAKQLDADVYCFQEVDARSDQLEQLTDALGPDYTAVALPNPKPASRKSLAVVTRLTVLGHDSRTDLGAWDIALRTRLATGNGALVEVVTTHLHFSPTPRGIEIRADQARRLLDWMGPLAGRAVVLCGDLNATAETDMVKTLKASLRSAFEVVHGVEADWTHPTPLVRVIDTEAAFGTPVLPEEEGDAIDFVLVGDPIEVLDCRMAFDRPAHHDDDLFPSDHLGVVARLRLPS